LRALCDELSSDQGTVFRYATHENTFLNHIYRQLLDDPADIRDRQALLDFIRSITHATKGSNSIKRVLPANLESSS